MQNIPCKVPVVEEEPRKENGFERAGGFPEFDRKDRGKRRLDSNKDRVDISDRNGTNGVISRPDESILGTYLKDPSAGESGSEGEPKGAEGGGDG